MRTKVNRLALFFALCAASHQARLEDFDITSESEASEEWIELREKPHWLTNKVEFGQIGGVDFNGEGHAVVFHRASRKWNDGDFDSNGVYTKAADGKIKENTFVVINRVGEVVNSWGADLFFMPHGLTIDSEENVWVTDVAAHQIYKFSPSDKKKPALVLGEAMKPGSDATHFCQPTDVAVASNGDFFVADGYCNSRVLKFDRTGKLIAQFGSASESVMEADLGTFSVPHSLALMEELDVLCVADRENERIQCFYAGLTNVSKTGELNAAFAYSNVERVYAIVYDKKDQLLHGVSVGRHSFGFSIAISKPEIPIISVWSPKKNFNTPHDIAVSPDCQRILVGEVGGNHLVLFEKSDY